MGYPQFFHFYTERDPDDGPSYPRWTVVGSVAKALAPMSQRTHVTDRRAHDGLSCTTVMLVRDPVSKGLSFFPKCSPTDTCDGPSSSCTTVVVVRDPVSKGLSFYPKCFSTETCDGPSSSLRSILHNRSGCQRPCF